MMHLSRAVNLKLLLICCVLVTVPFCTTANDFPEARFTRSDPDHRHLQIHRGQPSIVPSDANENLYQQVLKPLPPVSSRPKIQVAPGRYKINDLRGKPPSTSSRPAMDAAKLVPPIPPPRPTASKPEEALSPVLEVDNQGAPAAEYEVADGMDGVENDQLGLTLNDILQSPTGQHVIMEEVERRVKERMERVINEVGEEIVEAMESDALAAMVEHEEDPRNEGNPNPLWPTYLLSPWLSAGYALYTLLQSTNG